MDWDDIAFLTLQIFSGLIVAVLFSVFLIWLSPWIFVAVLCLAGISFVTALLLGMRE